MGISKEEFKRRVQEAMEHANKTEWTIERKRQVFSLRDDLEKIRKDKEAKAAKRKKARKW